MVVVSDVSFVGASPDAAGGGGGGAMPPGLDPFVAAAPAAEVSELEGVPVVVPVVEPAVVSEPLAGGGAAGDVDAAPGAGSCRRVRELFDVVFFDVVVVDDVAALAGGVRVGDGVVADEPDEPEPEDGVATGVRRFGVVCMGAAWLGCPDGVGAWPEVASLGAATVGTSGIGVAAGAGADDASGVGSGLCAWVIAAPARKIPATANDRQRFRIVSSFS